jgi:hypothetical protein
LVVLRLKGRFLLSPDLFWPKVDIGSTAGFPPAPFWPHLKEIAVEARLPSPEGLFYFDPLRMLPQHWILAWGDMVDMESDDISSDVPAVGELLVRVTRAMLQMPELDKLSIQFPETTLGDLISYHRRATLHPRHDGCYADGVSTGRHRQFQQPWRWHCSTKWPAEMDSNWIELVGRLCQTVSEEDSQHQ